MSTAASPAISVPSTQLDLGKIRADFPILSERAYGKPLVYLDNAASSQKPKAVIDALVRYYSTSNAKRPPRRTFPQPEGIAGVR